MAKLRIYGDNSGYMDIQPPATYQQSLRDITDTYKSLEDVVWPTKPEE